jgi:hypothetical protein
MVFFDDEWSCSNSYLLVQKAAMKVLPPLQYWRFRWQSVDDAGITTGAGVRKH